MTCIIIDDEPLAHQVLEHYINQTPGLTLEASFRNTIEAFEYLGKNQVDLLFLDIEMPLVNGLHFLKALPAPPPTIFTTAYKQYAYDGFELNAVDYLLKPFSYERFAKAVQKAENKQPASQPLLSGTLLIKDGKGTQLITQANITCVEGFGDYVKIHTAGQTYITYHTLKGILEKLDGNLFLQVHRSYIVNKTQVSRITADALILKDQSFLPLGLSYKKHVIENLSKKLFT
jgi:two-component system response regulator LytT